MSTHIQTLKQFEELRDKRKVLIVKWSTSFCGPCKMIQPTFDKLASKYTSDDIEFATIEADQDAFEKLTEEYSITAVPTFHVIKNGKLKDTSIGADKTKLTQFIEKHCGSHSA